MARHYDKGFKEDAVLYVQEHPELTVVQCARNLGMNARTLHGWIELNRAGEVHRGSGNYESDQAKEIARLKRRLQDTEDALHILKKAIGILND